MERKDIENERSPETARPGGEASYHPIDQHREWVRRVLECPNLDAARRVARSRYPDETPEQIERRIEAARTSGERKAPKPFQPLGVPSEIKSARKAARKVEVAKRRHLRRIDAVEKRLAAARRRSLRTPGKDG